MGRTLFRHADVLRMGSGDYLRNTDVLVENGKIAAVGADLAAAGADLVDCKGKVLMPSLIDAHAHIAREEMTLQYIACGVTAVRHLSGGTRQREYDAEVRSGKRIGPYIYSSGSIIDGVAAEDKNSSHVYVDGPDEAERAVRETVEAGYLWVKNYPSMTPEEMKRLMDTANSLGVKVSGHMSYNVDAKTLADWGYACCEHSSSLPKTDEEIDYIAGKGMWFCPTQVVCETLPDYVWNNKKFEDLPDYCYVPQYSKDYWEQENKRIIAMYKRRDLKPDINMIIARGRRFMERSDRYMAGSDAMYPGIIGGFALHDELRKLVELYGRRPIDALRAATVRPAEYMGLAGQKGDILPGMDADILILEKDPLSDIGNTRAIRSVMQGGRLYNRADLDSMLKELKDPAREFEILSPLF
ncbi:MAG: amidohydrolase family protein [Oscillospiraceae bacterium]|jgi:imidazolonepropionase-like amidohydrolase